MGCDVGDGAGGRGADDVHGAQHLGVDTRPGAGGTAADHDLVAGDNASLIRPVGGDSLWFQDDLDTSRGVTDIVRRVLQLFDVATAEEPDADDGVSGGDFLHGQNGFDIVYGQGGADVLRGGLMDDYLEGGNGSDDVQGNDGQDDIVGGTGRTRTDDPSSADDGRLDVGDTLYGGNGDPSEENDGSDADDFDVIMGDNATVLRGATGAPGEPWTHHDFGGAGVPIVDRTVTLHDVETLDYEPEAGTSGGDTLYGEDADDLLYGQGGNDTGYGGGGDDVIEGNAGDDILYGEGDQDDLLGGTGLIRWWDELAGELKVDTYDVDELVGGTAGRVDGADTIYGGGDHDVLLGDNGIIDRLAGEPTWTSLTYGHHPVQHDATDVANAPEVTGEHTRWVRTVRMTDPPDSPRTSGSDRLSGGDGDDDLYGQFDDTADDPDGSWAMTAAELRDFCPTSEIGDPGDGSVELWGDLLCGGAGEDAMLGDQGVVVNEVAAGPARFIEPKDPFVTEWVDIPGSLTRRTELTTFAHGGDDVLLGGSESDSIHAGAGGDVANAGTGDDRVFGGQGRRFADGGRHDALWGGPDNDHVYGGHGDDFIDVQPRSGIANFPDDPEQWFVFAPVVDTDLDGVPDRFPGFEDFDQHYGGWNQDAFQADKGDNGPIRGDRLLDWAGAHNVYYLCPSTYGAYVSIRAQEPGLVEYLEDMAEADGLVEVRTPGSSGYDELAMVYKKDINSNANPAHPDTPGHFSCAFVP